MRPVRLSLVPVLAGLICLAVTAQENKSPPLRATCTRDDATFKTGEEATFRVECDADAEVSYRLSEDGYATVKDGTLKVEKGKPIELTGSLPKPGFLQLRVAHGKTEALGSVWHMVCSSFFARCRPGF